jgi:DNA-binding protein YbaB
MSDSEQIAELLARNAAMLDSMGQLLASCQRELARAQQLNRDLRARTSRAQSPDGAVTVLVDGVGALLQLSFNADAFGQHSPASLADAVTQTVRDAARLQPSSKDTTLGQDVGPAPLLEPPRPDHHDGPPPILESSPTDFLVDDGYEEVEPVSVADPIPAPEPIPDSEAIPAAEPVLVPEPMPVPIQDPPAPPADLPPDSGSRIDHVVTALSRLQSYTGVVTRVLGVRDPERAALIAAQYQLGDTIIERTFLSTSANPAYTGDGLVRYTIDARHGGKVIGTISQDGEQFGEVVFGPGSRFRVTGKRYYPSIQGWDIALKELG